MHFLSARFQTRALLFNLITIALLSLSACRAVEESSPSQWSKAQFAGIPEASQLNELSGLTHSTRQNNLFWAINDGDNPSEMFAIDDKAQTKARYAFDEIPNIDWEDITSFELNGNQYLAIADTGDNNGNRTELFIYIIEEPKPRSDTGRIKPFRTMRFKWLDGARDVEALCADVAGKQFLLISKKRVPAEIYSLAFDAKDGDSPKFLATLEGISQPDEKTKTTKGDLGRYRAQITGADISPNGKWLAVLNYQQINFYALPKDHWPKKLYAKQTLDFPWLPQAEAIAYAMDGKRLFVGSEQSPAPIIRFDQSAP